MCGSCAGGPLGTKSSVLGERSWGTRGLLGVFTALESHRPQGTGRTCVDAPVLTWVGA